MFIHSFNQFIQVLKEKKAKIKKSEFEKTEKNRSFKC